MKPKKTIAIADDHTLFRNGMASQFKEFEEIDVIMQAGDGKDLLNQLKFKQPQVILLDIKMPVMDGIEVLPLIREKYPDVKIIMLTQYFDDSIIYHSMEKGAHGFLPKETDIERVIDAIYAVIEKGYFFTDEVSKAMTRGAADKRKAAKPFATCTLTDREIAVVRLLCKQMKIKEIAGKLNVSPRTIDSYMEKIYEKTGAKSREGIVFYAIEHKLLD
ncbi:MAG TPA: response regulator transcription factor [Bacteroidia bacterium]|jgi:two-component system response regulator DegU|nr:response regulator transcription factor [Bacteroidia bacterium]